MSQRSPSRKLRTKTSDLSDFFRNTHPSRPVPSDDERSSVPKRPVSSGSSKSKRSMIPFLGRTRKKSEPEPPLPSPSTSKFRDLAQPMPGTSPKQLPDGHVVLMISSSGESSSGHAPLPSTLPPLNVSPPSLASKFAAHFTPSKPRSLHISTQHDSQDLEPNQSLSPPLPSPRTASFESARSSITENRSTTPRPIRPTITVSELGKDLFTLPRATPSLPSPTSSPHSDSPSSRTTASNPTPPSSSNTHSDSETDSRASMPMIPSLDGLVEQLDIIDNASQSPSPPNSPMMAFPNPPNDRGYYESRGHLSVQEDSRSTCQSDESASSTHSSRRSSRRKHSVSVVKELEKVLGTKLDLDSGDDSDDNRISVTDRPKGGSKSKPKANPLLPSSLERRQTVATVPYRTLERAPSSSKLSRLPSVGSKSTTGPPSIPLPPPPSRPRKSSNNSMSSIPTIPSLASMTSTNSSTNSPRKSPIGPSGQFDAANRPRAHTISSVPPTSFSRPSLSLSPPSSALSSSSSPTASVPRMRGKSSDKTSQSETAEKESAHDQLRHLLAVQVLKFDQLSEYLFAITQKHAAEKTVMERRIETLEAEAEKREKELQGMRYLLMNSTGSNGSRAPSSTSSRTTDEKKRSQSSRSLPSSSSRNIAVKATVTKVSTSETSKIKRPTALILSASADDTKVKKPSPTNSDTLPETPKSARRISATGLALPTDPAKAGLGLEFSTPDSPYFDKRSSMSSLSSSAASSSSSISNPGLSAASTVSSSLSAIPETPSSARRRLDPAVAALIQQAEKKREKEERRASRSINRLSSSSTSSSASAVASNAYASNLKRSRPPSIAQVLQSPSMDDVLEKLKPFAGATPSNS